MGGSPAPVKLLFEDLFDPESNVGGESEERIAELSEKERRRARCEINGRNLLRLSRFFRELVDPESMGSGTSGDRIAEVGLRRRG